MAKHHGEPVRIKGRVALGIAVGIVGVVVVSLLFYPVTVPQSSRLELAATNSPAWQASICVAGSASVSFSWTVGSLVHNETSSALYGPLFTATVVSWGASGSISNPSYNSTGSSGSGTFVSSGVRNFAALDTRPTEAVGISLAWSAAGHVLTGPSGPLAC